MRAIIINAIFIGAVLVVSNLLFSDTMLNWFMSPEQGMVAIRVAILVGLAALLALTALYDNRAVRAVWGMAATMLAWMAYRHFLDDAAYIFDAVYLALASVCFAIASLQTTEETAAQPFVVPMATRMYTAFRKRASLAYAGSRGLLNQNSTLAVINWQNMQDGRHHLSSRRPVNV